MHGFPSPILINSTLWKPLCATALPFHFKSFQLVQIPISLFKPRPENIYFHLFTKRFSIKLSPTIVQNVGKFAIMNESVTLFSMHFSSQSWSEFRDALNIFWCSVNSSSLSLKAVLWHLCAWTAQKSDPHFLVMWFLKWINFTPMHRNF